MSRKASLEWTLAANRSRTTPPASFFRTNMYTVTDATNRNFNDKYVYVCRGYALPDVAIP
jgi:hypothetical protein